MDGRRARIVLGVDNDASSAEIRRAFRARALVDHPDRGGDRVSFELVVLAFETLQHVDVSHDLRVRPVRPMLPGTRPRVDVYDSPARPRPRRCFAEELRIAMSGSTL
jgi:DnaJ domain